MTTCGRVRQAGNLLEPNQAWSAVLFAGDPESWLFLMALWLPADATAEKRPWMGFC